MTRQDISALAKLYELDDPGRHEAWFARMRQDREVLALLHEAQVPVAQNMIDVQRLVLAEPRAQWTERPRLDVHAMPADAPPDACDEARAVREGRAKATDLVERALAREREQRHLHAFITVFDERARQEAAEIDRRVAAGDDVGPLAGLPVSVKDVIRVAGHAMTGGVTVLDEPPATRDAEAVARLRQAGAVIVGIANLHGLAYGATTINPDYGRACNPHRPQALSGGSSGGSAVAVAAGMASISLGTDTGGSVRIPAATCGVVGLKATFGRIPTDGVYPVGRTLDHVGPITRTVRDAAVVLEALSTQPFDAAATVWRDLDGIVVGLPRTYFCDHLAPEVRAAVDDCAAAITRLGGTVVDVAIPAMRYAPAAQLFTLAPEAFEVNRRLLAVRGSGLPEDVRVRLEMGMFFSAADYVRAQRLRALIHEQVNEALAQADILLTPAVAVPAPEAEQREVQVGDVVWPVQFALSRLAMPFTATGHPALTLPWAADARGCPIGVQLIARPMEEAAILGAGQVLECARKAGSGGHDTTRLPRAGADSHAPA